MFELLKQALLSILREGFIFQIFNSQAVVVTDCTVALTLVQSTSCQPSLGQSALTLCSSNLCSQSFSLAIHLLPTLISQTPHLELHPHHPSTLQGGPILNPITTGTPFCHDGFFAISINHVLILLNDLFLLNCEKVFPPFLVS